MTWSEPCWENARMRRRGTGEAASPGGRTPAAPGRTRAGNGGEPVGILARGGRAFDAVVDVPAEGGRPAAREQEAGAGRPALPGGVRADPPARTSRRAREVCGLPRRGQWFGPPVPARRAMIRAPIPPLVATPDAVRRSGRIETGPPDARRRPGPAPPAATVAEPSVAPVTGDLRPAARSRSGGNAAPAPSRAGTALQPGGRAAPPGHSCAAPMAADATRSRIASPTRTPGPERRVRRKGLPSGLPPASGDAHRGRGARAPAAAPPPVATGSAPSGGYGG